MTNWKSTAATRLPRIDAPNVSASAYEELGRLAEILRTLTAPRSAHEAITAALAMLEERFGVLRSAVISVDDSRQVRIEASQRAPLHDVRPRDIRGDSVIRRTLESGELVVVSEGDLTRLGVPLVKGHGVCGAFSAEFRCGGESEREAKISMMQIVASQIAHLVEARAPQAAEPVARKAPAAKGAKFEFGNIIGASSAMQEVYEQVEQVAQSNATVLVRGESGTGKELIAHAIHQLSNRAKKPLVKINCAALPDGLIESELYGYERGAFTGAEQRKKGRFELADGGTLFLDEIGELNLSTQVKLLRTLQEREVERLGGAESVKIDVRLVAATNKDLERAIASGGFREDLYYRVNVFTIYIPPLRERKSDILLLADHFLERYAIEYDRDVKRISTPAIDMLCSYHWPGNVRELQNVMERAVLVCNDNVIHGRHLPPTLQTAESTGSVVGMSLSEAVEGFEKDLIVDALKVTRGSQAKAARLLRTTERILGYKVRKYGVDFRWFRE